MKQVPHGCDVSLSAEAITEVGIQVIGPGEPDWVFSPSTAQAYWTDEHGHQTLYQVSPRSWILLEQTGWISSREVRDGRLRLESRRVGTGRVLQDSEAAEWLMKRGEEIPPELQSVAAQLKRQQVAWRPGDPIPQGLLAGLTPLQRKLCMVLIQAGGSLAVCDAVEQLYGRWNPSLQGRLDRLLRRTREAFALSNLPQRFWISRSENTLSFFCCL
jgi:hypothetical protein